LARSQRNWARPFGRIFTERDNVGWGQFPSRKLETCSFRVLFRRVNGCPIPRGIKKIGGSPTLRCRVCFVHWCGLVSAAAGLAVGAGATTTTFRGSGAHGLRGSSDVGGSLPLRFPGPPGPGARAKPTFPVKGSARTASSGGVLILVGGIGFWNSSVRVDGVR